MTFGQRLKKARLEKKYTQKQLANLIGAKHNSISNWENDQNKPDPDTIEYLCGALDIPVNYFFPNTCVEFEISPEEYEMIKKYRELDAHGKKIMDFILNEEYIQVCSKNNLMTLKMASRNGKPMIVTKSKKEFDYEFANLPDESDFEL